MIGNYWIFFASVVFIVVLLTMVAMHVAELALGRHYQFSLRTLLIATTLVAILLGMMLAAK